MVWYMETIDQTVLDLIWIGNGKILQKYITLKFIIVKKWYNLLIKLDKCYYFVIFMVIQWKRMLLFMEVMIVLILGVVKNFQCSLVNYLKDFPSKIAVFWRNNKNKVPQELFFSNKFLITISIRWKVLFVGHSMKIFTLLSDTLKN